MTLFILAETAAGYALFKSKDKKLLKRDSLAQDVENAEGVCNLLKLKQFKKFESAATAVEEVTALVDGKVTPFLSDLLNIVKDEHKASLAVADPKLGKAIRGLPEFDLTPVSDDQTLELYRSIRSHASSLIPGLAQSDINTMALGLSHSLARHKLKFSPEKIDIMIVHAIGLLDDLDKDLNTCAMRVKEWYGWHFPEMGKIINDNLAYARIIKKMGFRSSAAKSDLSDILPEEIETAVKAAAEVSMGMEMTDDDLENIQSLAEQVIGLTEYRQQLSSHLSARMAAIAPNLTMLVGELVGARLIAHAGSLMNLSKSPASTIQILGAEKALFRALKTKHDTPKYGLIYHASLIGQATGKNKGKIARMLAAKAALGIRVDALADWNAEADQKTTEEEKGDMGFNSRAFLERRLRVLEGKSTLPLGVAIGPSGASAPSKFEIKEARKYNINADGLEGNEPAETVLRLKEPDEPMTDLLPPTDKAIKKLIEEVKNGDHVGASDEEDEDESEDESDDDAEDKKSTYETKASTLLSSSHDTKALNGNDSSSSQTLPKRKSEESEDDLPSKKKSKKEKHAKEPENPEQKAPKYMTKEQKDKAKFGAQAEHLGLSVLKYKRKLKKNEIGIDDEGLPFFLREKDRRKQKKKLKGKKPDSGEKKEKKDKKAKYESKKKRRLEEEEGEERVSKKKKSSKA